MCHASVPTSCPRAALSAPCLYGLLVEHALVIHVFRCFLVSPICLFGCGGCSAATSSPCLLLAGGCLHLLLFFPSKATPVVRRKTYSLLSVLVCSCSTPRNVFFCLTIRHRLEPHASSSLAPQPPTIIAHLGLPAATLAPACSLYLSVSIAIAALHTTTQSQGAPRVRPGCAQGAPPLALPGCPANSPARLMPLPSPSCTHWTI